MKKTCCNIIHDLRHKAGARFVRRIMAALILIILTFVTVHQFAQNQKSAKDKLISKKKKIEAEIAYNKKLLNETSKTKKMSLNQLNLLRNQIQKREALLQEINSEIDKLNREIHDNDAMLVRQNENLRILKDEYAKIIYHEWKTHNSYDRILFIFSADDFNQAYRRLKYFQQYSEYRSKQAELIVEVQHSIAGKLAELQVQRETKTQLLSENANEKKRLDEERTRKDQAVKQLKKQEASLRKALKTKQAEALKLQSKIEAIIAEEIKRAAANANKSSAAAKDLKSMLTPEEKKLSDNFISNKGKLPWPVAQGAISEFFGEHDHPDLPGIKVKNNGLDIATTAGASARAVFSGTVTNIISITGSNNAVIIRHGDYFTVYSNMKTVSVQKGSKVSTKQSIGTVYTNSAESQTLLHFELWQGKTPQNPAFWLAK